jgi:hypothetical protein
MHHREPKGEIDDTGQFLQGASCTVAAVEAEKQREQWAYFSFLDEKVPKCYLLGTRF